MLVFRLFLIVLLFSLTSNLELKGNEFIVDSQSTFNDALSKADINDTISWENGSFADIYMNISKQKLLIRASMPGGTIFTGESRVFISGDHIILSGFQFIGGDIGTQDVIKTTGSYNQFTHLNIKDYTSYKYLVIKESCQYNIVAYCNFENRLNLDDKNILSVLVNAHKPGYHLIQYCSFKNFDGVGADMGIEPIRIGLSTQGEFSSRTIVEYCYFTMCNGDGEIISNKARHNVFRYNTFEDNPKSELVLRHGDYASVYGNFFLNGMGGIRIKEGQGHAIYNNYFSRQSRRSMILMNYGVDPLDSILIAYNTIVNSEEIVLGGTGSFKPTNVTFANNIFTDPIDELFDDPTGHENWIGNIFSGDLGFSRPPGLTEVDPLLFMNSAGFYDLLTQSPAINAAEGNYPEVFNIPGIDNDHLIQLDLIQTTRPIDEELKDVGCLEYQNSAQVQPLAREENTGPMYLWDKGAMKLRTKSIGEGIINANPPAFYYYPSTKVSISAIAGDDHYFSGWKGDIGGSENPKTIQLNNDMDIIAEFKLNSSYYSLYDKVMAIKLFPNPADNILVVEIKSIENNTVSLTILDQVGNCIKDFNNKYIQAGLNTVNIDLFDLSSGLYFLHVNIEGKSVKPFSPSFIIQ